jgi:hypothetical protein
MPNAHAQCVHDIGQRLADLLRRSGARWPGGRDRTGRGPAGFVAEAWAQLLMATAERGIDDQPVFLVQVTCVHGGGLCVNNEEVR